MKSRVFKRFVSLLLVLVFSTQLVTPALAAVIQNDDGSLILTDENGNVIEEDWEAEFPYHGKTGQHALTALKTMKSQTLCAAALCGIRRHQMTRFKIAHRRFESFTRCQMENLGTAMVPRFFFVLKGLQFPHFPRSSKYTIKNQQNSPNLNWTAAAFSSIITSSFYRRRPVWRMRSRKKLRFRSK